MSEQTVTELLEEMTAAVVKLEAQFPHAYPEARLQVGTESKVPPVRRVSFTVWNGHHHFNGETLLEAMTAAEKFNPLQDKVEEVQRLQAKLEAAQKELAELEGK